MDKSKFLRERSGSVSTGKLRKLPAESKDIGGGFSNHGKPVRLGWFRGMVCAENARGEGVVLIWLGMESLLEINVVTGEYREHENRVEHHPPFASILSSEGRLYTHVGHQFIIFDPKGGGIKREGNTTGELAYERMAESDDGRIWAVMLPDCSIASYDPATGEVHDYGCVKKEDFRQRPCQLTPDAAGWLYFVETAATPSRWMMFNPFTGKAVPALPGEVSERISNENQSGKIERGEDGKVYLGVKFADTGEKVWFELYGGEAREIASKPDYCPKKYITGNYNYCHRVLPGGERVKDLDLELRSLIIEDATTGQSREIKFDYRAAGLGGIMGVESTLQGTIVGGTMKPWRFFSYDPAADVMSANLKFLTQWNAMTRTKDGIVYAGLHPGLGIMEYDPKREWTDEGHTSEHNPRYILGEDFSGRPYVVRVTDILAYPPEERYIILAGHSDEGHMAGGGLLFFDRETESYEILTHEALIPNHDNFVLAALPDDRLLVGTTPWQYASELEPEDAAKLYILNINTKEIEWQGGEIENMSGYYRDMFAGPGGKVFVLVTRWVNKQPRLFVFDSEQKTLTKRIDVPAEFGHAVGGQAPRTFVETPEGRIFMLFSSAIGELNPETYELINKASLPRGFETYSGGAYYGGRLYFSVNRANLCSWKIPAD